MRFENLSSIGYDIMLEKFATFWAAIAVVIASAASATAQESWADRLVQPKKIDFGVIATGSETLRVVEIENTTNVVVHISGTSTACLCAKADPPSQTVLQPGDKATIEVRMDTRSFKQQRDTSLTINFDTPQFASVRIPIRAYIRTDVVFKPGKIDFGSTEVGTGAQLTCKIEYAGRPDWQILDVKYSNKDLSAVLKETGRNPGLGTAEFDLTMTLSPSAKPGRIREIVTIITDDSASPHVPLMVEGIVKSDITLANSNIKIRDLKPGETTTVKVVVQGTKPFIVEDVDCPKMQDCFKVKLDPTEKKLQIVELQFTAPNAPGSFAEEMIVKIKGREDTLQFKIMGRIN